MYIIFGTSKKIKCLANSKMPRVCNNCNTSDYWQFNKVRPYFTLFFFIRIFPIGKPFYVYNCPKCKFGYDITPENLNQILNELNFTNELNLELNSNNFKNYMAKLGGNPQINNNQNNMYMNNNIQNNNNFNQGNMFVNNNQPNFNQNNIQQQNNPMQKEIIGYDPQTGQPIYK